jgi:hypothetical protein
MTCCQRGYVLPVLCSLMFAGCTAHFKDPGGERLNLSGYDRIAVKPVEVASRIARRDLAEDLAAAVRDRLTESECWTHAAVTSQPADAASGRQVDLAVTVLKAKYPSRSKIIWLGSAHKMTCRLRLHDHATGELLGSAKASVSVNPLLGHAAMLNAGAVGILARTALDTRKHDARALLEEMAGEIVEALDDTKE